MKMTEELASLDSLSGTKKKIYIYIKLYHIRTKIVILVTKVSLVSQQTARKYIIGFKSGFFRRMNSKMPKLNLLSPIVNSLSKTIKIFCQKQSPCVKVFRTTRIYDE